MIVLCCCYWKGKTRQKEIERQKDTALKRLENEKAEIERQKDTALKKLKNEKAEIERQKDTALKNLEIEKEKTGVKMLVELRKIGGPELFKMEHEKLKQYLNVISDFISHTTEADQPNRVVSDGDEMSEKDRETKRQIMANFLKDVYTQVQTHISSDTHS